MAKNDKIRARLMTAYFGGKFSIEELGKLSDKQAEAVDRVIDKAIELIRDDKPAEQYICCEELEHALGDHNGLHSQTIGSIHSDEIDSVIMYKGGDYKIRNRIVVQYCPFCGKPRRKASEYKK